MHCKRRDEREDQPEAKSRKRAAIERARESEKRRKRMETRRACLNEATLEPDPIDDLLVRNTLEYMDMATS